MKLHEIKGFDNDLYNNDGIELYETKGKRFELHGDFIDLIDEYNTFNDIESKYMNRRVLWYGLMAAQDYIDTICANSCITIDDIDETCKYYVIVIE